MSESLTDKQLFKPNLLMGIVCLCFGIMFSGLSASPFNPPMVSTGYIIAGAIFTTVGILNFVIYGVKPEPIRQFNLRIVEKAKQRKVRKEQEIDEDQKSIS